MTTKKLLLSYHEHGLALNTKHVYRVEKVSNSTHYKPGQALTCAEVMDLCELGLYLVDMVMPKKEA